MAAHGESALIAGRYRIGERLGRGGMGTVWRATDELLGRQVAVKELHLDEGLSEDERRVLRERTLREARAVAQLGHPNILVLHDVVEQDGRPWIVMELIDGRSLAERVAADGTLEPREAARVGLALLGALRAAHGRGVQHRDIKPANVLLEAESGRTVLTDFGIASVSGLTTISETGSLFGSPEYMAPERMSGERAGPEADLWSLGVLLCAAVEGETPFHRESLTSVVHAVALEDIRLPASAGPLLPVVRGLLTRDVAARTGVDEAERLLRAVADGEPAPVPAPPPPSAPVVAVPSESPTDEVPAARRGKRTPLLVTAVLVAALAGGGVAAGVVLSSRDGTDRTDTSASAPGAASGSRTDGEKAKEHEPSQRNEPSRKPTSKPDPDPEPTSKPKLPSAPDGYRTVDDPLGFRMAVPKGFTRSLEPPRVFYYSPGKRFRIGIHIQDQHAGGSLGAMRSSHKEGPDRYPGYHDAEVHPREHNGFPGARWEFSWNGEKSDGGPRHTFDQSWDENGKMYDVWVSSPLPEVSRGERYFDTALKSFVRTRPR
ncbi:serine/threonine-protein kinase [Streptomyces sp. NPDC048172]|uniref:serine/threonine-protein kinase n=1 Tax=Streptomyces sp. NPDC048172 TaxID=3365505 RepID=UPI00371CF69D